MRFRSQRANVIGLLLLIRVAVLGSKSHAMAIEALAKPPHPWSFHTVSPIRLPVVCVSRVSVGWGEPDGSMLPVYR